MNTEPLLSTGLLGPLLLSCLAVTGLVLCDYLALRAGRYFCKPLAAAAFVWLALVPGLPDNTYGNWMLAGLLCCMLGDLLLMPDSERFFLAGLVAFLCGHLLYAVAFVNLHRDSAGLLYTAIPVITLLVLSLRWLLPHLDPTMRIPVIAYTLVISGMLLCAGLSLGHAIAPLIILGAWGFAISDLAVARQQFVRPAFANGLWGTPLYFLSQMLLAYTVVLVSAI